MADTKLPHQYEIGQCHMRQARGEMQMDLQAKLTTIASNIIKKINKQYVGKQIPKIK